LKVKRWGKPNVVHNANKKILEVRQKGGMNRQANNQTQDFKHAHCESKDILKMMLKKEWLYNLFKMFF
jgi:hypothetical protein